MVSRLWSIEDPEFAKGTWHKPLWRILLVLLRVLLLVMLLGWVLLRRSAVVIILCRHGERRRESWR
jgi:hypothetical protein